VGGAVEDKTKIKNKKLQKYLFTKFRELIEASANPYIGSSIGVSLTLHTDLN
jgi:hypothetical protein